jgi:hypothetical protein
MPGTAPAARPLSTADCHACGGAPRHHWRRTATEDEAAAYVAEIRRHRREDLRIPSELTYQAIALMYGPAHVAVHGCADHDLAPACGGDEAAAAQAGAERRALLHAADCAGHGACACEPPAAAS